MRDLSQMMCSHPLPQKVSVSSGAARAVGLCPWRALGHIWPSEGFSLGPREWSRSSPASPIACPCRRSSAWPWSPAPSDSAELGAVRSLQKRCLGSKPSSVTMSPPLLLHSCHPLFSCLLPPASETRPFISSDTPG